MTNQTAQTIQRALQDLLRAEIGTLQALLDARFQEIATLTLLLDKAEQEGAQEAKAQIAAVEHRHHIEKLLLMAGHATPWDDSETALATLETRAQTLAASTLFDGAWYLQTYPDLAEAGIDPVDHYIRAGALEGRNPSPGFDTMAYYLANPDVAQDGWAALVHYEMFGRAENRPLHPNG